MSKIKKEQEPAYIFASFLIGVTVIVSWLKFRGFITAEWDLILLPVGFFFVSGVAFEFVRKMQGLRDDTRLIKQESIEEAAAIQHEIWGHWMTHLFTVSKWNSDGSVTISRRLADKWKGQARTKYENLTEKEKKSDRDQVEKFKHLLK